VLGFRCPRDLTARRRIPIELPEFLIVLLEHREQEANDGASLEERVTMNHFVEYQVADLLSIRDVAELRWSCPASLRPCRSGLQRHGSSGGEQACAFVRQQRIGRLAMP
jgi:hypothetical protein